MNSSGKTDPRYVSLLILNEYFIKRTSLKNLINNYLDKNPLSDLDRRFLFEIVKGTVRFLLKIDYLIGVFSDIKIEKM
ncbi:MAG: hypothetical protein FJW66_06775, partial [Actinobacteria bacterium]|nr:hypothetical protein [Actinomycetota bacterium]